MTSADTAHLETATRSELIARAEALGVEKADVLTRPELLDEIIKRTIADPIERRLARGFLGVARDLVARVVERGLHLPDAAAIIRGLQHVTLNPGTPPIATVMLAEIYAGQGHRARALAVLDEVLDKEPDHAAARRLRDRVLSLEDDQLATIAPPEPEIAPYVPPVPAAPAAAESFPSDREEPNADDGVVSGVVASGVVEIPATPITAEIDAMERDLPAPDPALAAFLESDEESAPETPRDVAPPMSAFSEVATNDVSFERPVEEDHLVLVSVDGSSALACWELGGWALDAARDGSPDGKLILRVVAVTPTWDGPVSEVRDVDLPDATGEFWIGELPPKAVLRAAIGWRTDAGFDPLAVALDLIAAKDEDEVSDQRLTIPAGDIASDERRTIPVTSMTSQRKVPLERRARRRVEQARSERGPTSSSWRTLTIAPWEPPYEAPPPAILETR